MDLESLRSNLAVCIDAMDGSMKRGEISYDDWVDIRTTAGALYNSSLGITPELIAEANENQNNSSLFRELLEKIDDFIKACTSDFGIEASHF